MTLFKRARRFVSRARFCFLNCGGLLICLLVSSCARHEPPADLTILNGVEPESLDPAIIVAQADARTVSGMFEGLTRYDAVDAHAIPSLAQSWEISPDG